MPVVEMTREIKTDQDALAVVAAVRDFCVANKDAIERLPQLAEVVKDLGEANRVLAESDRARMMGGGGPVGGSLREMVSTYTIRSDELVDGAQLRAYQVGGKEIKEELGGVRLFGRSWEKDDGSGIETDWEPGLLDDPHPVTEAQRELQRDWTKRTFLQSLQRSLKPGVVPRTPALDRRIRRQVKAMGGSVERAFADATGVGAEWIPDDYLPSVETYVKHNRQVAALFRELPVTRDTSLLPYLSAGFIPYIHGEVDSDDYAQIKLSTMSTAQRTITVKTLAVRTQIGDNAAEDAYLPFLDIILTEGGFALISGEEDALINGDTTATHADTGLATWNPDSFYPSAPGGLSIDHRRICQGLRERASEASNTTDRGTFSSSTFATDMASLIGPKQGPGDAVAIVNNYILATKIFPLAEVVTREKYGDGAAILTGEIGRLFGRPLIPSQFLTKDLNASGIFDDATTTKSGLIQCLRGRFVRPVRRGVTVEFQRDATRGITHVVWKMRGLPIKQIGATTEKNAHFAYNMA